jgi:tellurite resistance protein TerC
MTAWLWIGFIVMVVLLLALDLGVLNRKDHVIGAREALLWTGFWVLLALVFDVAVYFIYENHWLGVGIIEGGEQQLIELPLSVRSLAGHLSEDLDVSYRVSGEVAAVEYLTGYLIEKSLSLDNIFVIALIFRHFAVRPEYQHRVLFWGIVGALIMRGAMIGAGVVLIQRFFWTVYVFGGFLILTAIRMAVVPETDPDLEKSKLVRLVRRIFPVTTESRGHAFFLRVPVSGGAVRWAVTPLFLVLVVVELSDVLFAVDSIPAIFAITRDPFIVFTSNIFALLGLRSLFFAVAQLLRSFHYLQHCLVVILGYVGVKMILSHHLRIPPWTSLAVIGGLLLAGVVASLARSRVLARRGAAAALAQPDEIAESGAALGDRNRS